MTIVIILWILAVVLVVIIVGYVTRDYKKRKLARKLQREMREKMLQMKKNREQKKPTMKRRKRPRQIRAAKINLKEFKRKGPLVLQAKLQGDIRHNLDQEKSASLKDLKFDPAQNSIVLIGTEIEKLEGQSLRSTDGGDPTYENLGTIEPQKSKSLVLPLLVLEQTQMSREFEEASGKTTKKGTDSTPKGIRTESTPKTTSAMASKSRERAPI